MSNVVDYPAVLDAGEQGKRAVYGEFMDYAGDRWYAIRAAADLSRDIGSFQLVEGRVVDVADVRGTVYLNFGADWRSDFTIKVAKRSRKSFDAADFDLQALEGRIVCVRGWIDAYNGPMIETTHPEQIEILDN